MSTRTRRGDHPRDRKPMAVGLLLVALTVPLCVTAHGEGFEPYSPTNDLLRRTIQGVVESQAFRHPPALERDVQEALRSIAETEGRTDPQFARHLSAHLRSAWIELERSRVVSELGYPELDEATFRASDVRFQEIVAQYSGARTPYSKARNRTAMKALTDIRTLSRNARRHVPGLSSDDVHLMQEKRWDLQWKTVVEEHENPPLKESKVTPRRETAPSR